MSDKEVKEIKLSFSADGSLMYLIQQTTKQPTEEILGFFYDLGVKVAEIGVDNMEGRGIRKDIRDVYPNSSVPFKLLVKGQMRHNFWDPNVKGYVNRRHFSGHIEVTFPDQSRMVDQKALMEKIFEKNLLGGESLPNFPQPQVKTPKMYKDLIEEVLNKK